MSIKATNGQAEKCPCGSALVKGSGFCLANITATLLLRDDTCFLGHDTQPVISTQFKKSLLWTAIAPQSVFEGKQQVVLNSKSNNLILCNIVGAGKSSSIHRVVFEKADIIHKADPSTWGSNLVGIYRMSELTEYWPQDVIPILKRFPILVLQELGIGQTDKAKRHERIIQNTLFDQRQGDLDVYTYGCTNLPPYHVDEQGNPVKNPAKLSPLATLLGGSIIDRANQGGLVNFNTPSYRGSQKEIVLSPQQQVALEKYLGVHKIRGI
jgi:hypothetical protein